MSLPSCRATLAPASLRAILRFTLAAVFCVAAHAQQVDLPDTSTTGNAARFLAERTAAHGSAAEALLLARAQHARLLGERRRDGQAGAFSAAWQPLGPSAVLSSTFGKLTGRVTSVAVDPNDKSGNTVYLGTTGGGVWKSTNAGGPLASATFVPLTDVLPVFSPNSGSSAIPSLSVGAVSVQPAANPVVLAGTGDPNGATDSLYGEGILRSADGGLTWTLIQAAGTPAVDPHSFVGLPSAGFAWGTNPATTASTGVVVAAFSTSPESLENGATTSTYAVPGLYYSTDAGQTWQMSTIYDGATVVQQPLPVGTGQTGNAATSVVWDAQRGRFFAAVRAHGYYSSADGVTWTRLSVQPGTSLTAANCPANTNAAGSAGCPIFRGTLAVQPVTGDLYALTVDANNADQGLWQDLCQITASGACATAAPVFAAQLENGALAAVGSAGSTPAGYSLALAAAPAANNSTLLFAGTTDLYRCSLAAGAASCTFRNATNAANYCATPAGVAPAQHALAFQTQTGGSPLLYAGNDGGLWRSLDGVAESGSACSASDASHFDNLNGAIAAGGSLAEVTGLAQHPSDPNTLLAGLGANGTAATAVAGALGLWPQIAAGAGGVPLIDTASPTNWFAAIGAGVNLKFCANGSACTLADFLAPATIGAVQVGNDAALADAPMVLDPAATTNLLVGTCRVWRGPASSGALWYAANALSPALGGGAAPCTTSSPLVRSVAAGGPAAVSTDAQHNGSTVLYAGLAGLLDGGGKLGGHVFVTTSANLATSATAWTDISLNPVTNGGTFNPYGFAVSSLDVDPHDATGATVYATVMGFGSPHVYRSADFGKHWLNITANLPDAPANSVIVDPNDANTVYVAMDTGVYATQTVSACNTLNCWSVLGSGLPNSPVTQLQAGAQLPTGDGRLGMLRAATYGRGLWQMPLLSALSVAAPALTASATSLSFTAQQVATQSAAQTITLTSSGSAPASVSSVVVSGDFAETDTCAGQNIPVGAACSLQVRFAPTATGARSGVLTVYANIPGGQVTVALYGTATAPGAILLTPVSLTFSPTVVNQTSTTQIITIANTGGSTATLQTLTVAGDFSIAANTCAGSLASQTSCSVSIAFTPTAAGTRSGTLTVVDSAGTQTAQFTGSGEAPATDTLSATALVFTQQAVGSSSTAQQVTLTNAGDVPLINIVASVSGGDFTSVNGCGTSLAGHAACAIYVSFIPSATGTRSATLMISDQFRSQSVALSGVAVAPAGVSLSPTSLSFAATGVGLTAPAQILTLTNNGGIALTLTKLAISPDFAIANNTCGSTLAAASVCTLTVVFAPGAAGVRSGTLVLTDNAPSGSQTVNLSGIAVDFTLAANGLTAATISGSNGSATYPMLLNSLAGLSGNVAFACTGAPAHGLCTVNPGTAALGGSVAVSATVQTGLLNVMLSPRDLWNAWKRGIVVFACMLPWMLPGRRRKPALLVAALGMLALGSISGCGTARTIPGSGSVNTQAAPTPTGTYTLTVTATSAGISHSVPLTLTVQ